MLIILLGIPSTIENGESFTITVQAKTSTGSTLTSGGDSFQVEISNKCTLSGTTCTDDGTSSALSSTVSGAMTDHGNGTYTYAYTFNGDAGELTVAVFLSTQDAVATFYDNTDWTDPVKSTKNFSRWFMLGLGTCDACVDVTSGSNWSGRITAKITSPISGTLSFSYINTAAANYESKFYINDAHQITLTGVD